MSYDQAYQHVERYGTTEVHGIDEGPCYVFPKLDGTNAVVWWDGAKVCFGSRKRVIAPGCDNQGFAAFMSEPIRLSALEEFFCVRPNATLYFEWLVPHTIKNYLVSAWRKAYLIDVQDCSEFDECRFYWRFEHYQHFLTVDGVEVVPPLFIGDVDYAKIRELAEGNTYKMKDGEIGEGVVIKRYDWVNRFGRSTWAKFVRDEFRDKHGGKNMAEKVKPIVEEAIAERFLSRAIVQKVYANIVADLGGWDSKAMPRFLNTVYYDFVREEMWSVVKDLRNPTVNFKSLQATIYRKAKEMLDDELLG